MEGHSVERVIEELSILHYEYGIKEIEFLDDTFTLNKKRAIDISLRIKQEGLDISWTALLGSIHSMRRLPKL